MNSVDEVKISDKCKRYRVNIEQEGEQQVPGVDLLEKHIPIQGSHGDMVIIGEKALRSLNVYFINVIIEEDENECKKVVRKLVQTDNTGSGYCCVPLEVTRKIDDPLKFYENSFTFDEYDEIDFSGIEIDTVEHQHVIKRFTNGKEVAPNRKCFYFFSYNEWDSGSGMFIWCDFFLDDFDSGRYIKLTPDIDEAYLVESPTKIRDNQVVQSSVEMKQRYEDKFTATFISMPKGTEVEVYGVAFFNPKNSQSNSGLVLTMNLERVEAEVDGELINITDNGSDTGLNSDKISTIVLTRSQGSQLDESNKNSDENKEFMFKQKVLCNYGRFGEVKLWCSEDTAILPGDDLQTYVICTSDLFLSQF